MRYKVCRKPDCDVKIPFEQDNPYCANHASMWHQQTPYVRQHSKQRQKFYNRYKRDKEANKFYHTKQWANLSQVVKKQAYFTCECCGHTYDKPRHLITDHIVPRRIDKRKRLDRDNLWAICSECHYWKTRLENKVYTSQSLIANLDVAKRWNKERCTEWIMEQRRKRNV